MLSHISENQEVRMIWFSGTILVAIFSLPAFLSKGKKHECGIKLPGINPYTKKVDYCMKKYYSISALQRHKRDCHSEYGKTGR